MEGTGDDAHTTPLPLSVWELGLPTGPLQGCVAVDLGQASPKCCAEAPKCPPCGRSRGRSSAVRGAARTQPLLSAVAQTWVLDPRVPSSSWESWARKPPATGPTAPHTQTEGPHTDTHRTPCHSTAGHTHASPGESLQPWGSRSGPPRLSAVPTTTVVPSGQWEELPPHPCTGRAQGEHSHWQDWTAGHLSPTLGQEGGPLAGARGLAAAGSGRR